MKSFKHLFLTLLICFSVLCLFHSEEAQAAESASGTCGSGLTWVLDDSGVLTISGNGAMDDWSNNGPWGDYYESIQKVVVESGVTHIGENAFNSYALDYYVDGGSYSKLQSVTIPSSVTSIGENAFYDCENLSSVTLAYGVKTIDELAFGGCTALQSITLPESVTSIVNAFTESGLTSITIPKSVTDMAWAFKECHSLTSVTISSGVTSIGDLAFAWCENLTSVTIPKSVTSIGDHAFMDAGLTSVDLPSGTELGANVFHGCPFLDDMGEFAVVNGVLCQYNGDYDAEVIEIPDGMGITIIDGSVYGGTFGGLEMQEVIIPDGVTEIRAHAFIQCVNLESIDIPDSVISLGDEAFANCAALTTVKIGNGCKTIGKECFRILDLSAWSSSLTTVELGKSVESIGAYAFCSCKKLKSINLPDTLTQIGADAFNGCQSLTSIVIPDNVEIKDAAFFGCYSLAYISFGEGCTVGSADDTEIFDGCKSLVSIAIPDGQTMIAMYTFSGCYSLTSITIPSSVTKINSAFRADSALTDIYYTGTEEQWNAINITSGTANQYFLAATVHYNSSGHTHSFTSVKTAATCSELGYTTYTCTSCGFSYTGDYTATADHTWNSGTVTTAATETTTGVMTYTCTVCGTTKTETIPVSEHVHSYTAVTTEATCTTPESTTYTCSCGDSYVEEGTTLAAHSYTASTYSPTCKDQGYTKYVCKNCGDTYTGNYTDPSPEYHTWDSGTVTTAATYTTTGVRTYTCTTCSATKTETIAATGVTAPALTSVANTADGVTVQWSQVSGASYYRVLYKVTGASDWSQLSSATAGTSASVTGLTSGTNYTFTVVCTDNGGNTISDYNSGLTITWLSRPGVTVAAAKDGITVSWDSVSGASSYLVYRKTSGGSFSRLTEVTSTSYTDTTAASGTTYYYTVRAKNGSDLSAYITSASALWLSIPTVTVANSSGGVTIKWSAVTGAQGYYVYRKVSGGSWKSLKGTTATSYTDTTATSGTTYYYTVRAKNGSILSSFVTDVSIVCLSVPTLKSATAASGKITVTWNKVTGAQGYFVYRKEAGGKWVKVKGTTATSYTDSNVTAGTTYYYTVRASANSGKSLSAYNTSGVSAKAK